MKRPKGNLLDWLRNRRRKAVPAPKPQPKESAMSKNLIAQIKILLDAFTGANKKIAEMESANRSLAVRVKDLEDAAAAAAAEEAEMAGVIESTVAAGASMGGSV